MIRSVYFELRKRKQGFFNVGFYGDLINAESRYGMLKLFNKTKKKHLKK
jgi:hypothetical protein